MRKALIVGCARSVWDEVKAAQELCIFDATYCVKSAGIHWPGKFDVWVTLHPEAIDDYEAERKKLGFPGGYEIVSTLDGLVGMHKGKGKNIRRKLDYRWPGMNASASSGIFAVKVAMDDGYERIVLAGIPMDKDAGHFLPGTRTVNKETVRGPQWLHRDSFMPGFEIAKKFMAGKVRSMSGHTAKVLGSPDRAWLNGETPQSNG